MYEINYLKHTISTIRERLQLADNLSKDQLVNYETLLLNTYMQLIETYSKEVKENKSLKEEYFSAIDDYNEFVNSNSIEFAVNCKEFAFYQLGDLLHEYNDSRDIVESVNS